MTEWRAANPSANTFNGTRRELLRVGHIVNNLFHPLGDISSTRCRSPDRPTTG